MPQILGNVTAMAASRQLNVTNSGLQMAIQRLTTGKRINSAADGATDLANGTSLNAGALTAQAQVIGFQQTYFQNQASDSNLQEATNQATRLAELEGTTGGTSSAEYTAVEGLVSTAAIAGGMAAGSIGTMLTGNAVSAAALTAIAAARSTLAANMATAQSQTNLHQILSENDTSQSDAIMGADIGAETVNLTKYQILMQAGTSALAQANQSSNSVLALFR